VWQYLKPNGRIVATANNLETLYQFSEGFSNLQAREYRDCPSGSKSP
jgi:cobalt-precorrin-6B (C15)-methyltransferase